MNKIIKAALTNRGFDIEDIMMVIEATPNPEIAAEILLGIHDMPKIKATSTNLESRYHNPQFISYNPINQKVTFDYERVETKDCWFNINCDDMTVIENAVVEGVWSTDTAYEKYRQTTSEYDSLAEFKKNFVRKSVIVNRTGIILTDTVSLRDWQ